MNRKAKPPAEAEPHEVVTFRRPNDWILHGLITPAPSCFNSDVHFRRWRITVELIEEPHEVLKERLCKLWRQCHNMHHHGPLQDAARELGFRLFSEDLGKEKEEAR